MPMGEFTSAGADEALEKLRELFNAIPSAERSHYLYQFSLIGTYIQASQRSLAPLCGSTPTNSSESASQQMNAFKGDKSNG